jgi:S-adenosylmethionine-diacylglycerol 3-amino-3-carboxypropyl transferase
MAAANRRRRHGNPVATAAAASHRVTAPPLDRLVYGQNWEDSAVEIAALDIEPKDRVIAVAGAGCTVLALLARGPQCVHAVDRNAAQLHLLLLKLAAVCELGPGEAAAFLGGAAAFLGGAEADRRRATFAALAPNLPEDTARFWGQHSEQIERGVISQGRVERYFGLLRRLLRLVHSRRRIEEVFEQATLEAQQSFYRDHWDTAGWRALFLLAHKKILDRVLDPSFYQYVDARGLPRVLRERAERCMTTLPIRSNYFLSWILRGRYGRDEPERPAYLGSPAAAALKEHRWKLRTHLTDIRAFLRTMPDSSGDKFYLSNVGEWLSDEELGPFFAEVGRVARDGATVCYRALMADRPLPASVERLFDENRARSAALAASDRAFINAGFHVVTVRKHGSTDGRP